MSEKENQSFNERIASLEAQTKELQQQMDQLNSRLLLKSEKNRSKPAVQQPGSSFKMDYPWSHWKSEDWLSKTGIALVLFAVVFLFKYSIDQGWLTPVIRVWIGTGLGMLMITLGLFIYSKRNKFALVLIGGGIAALYITDFAAFQFYGIIPYTAAFSCMAAVTLLSLFLSVKKNRAILSIIGTIGGLGTPFLLYTDEGSIFGLITYTCLVIAGTIAIYMFRGWRSILLVSAAGGWLIFLISSGQVGQAADISLSDRSIVQAGIFFGLLAYWFVPVIRDVLRAENPGRWHTPSLDFLDKYGFQQLEKFINRFTHILVVVIPLAVLGLSHIIWDISDLKFGLFTLAGSSFFAAAFMILNKRDLAKLAYTHGLITILLLTLSIVQIFDGNLLFIGLAVEAAILHHVANKLSDSIIKAGAHFLFIITAFILLNRLSTIESSGLALLNKNALSDLAVMAVALSVISLLKNVSSIRLYGIITHLGFIALLAREFFALDSGQAYVTISWGVYAIILIFVAYKQKNDMCRMAGLTTLLLVVGKLFLVDLTYLKAIWRILLFFGFGGLFLILSYYMPGHWKSSSAKGNSSETK